MKKLSLSASRFIIYVTVISVILLMGSFSIITPSAAAAGTDIKIFLNNTPLEFGVYENDPEPYIKEGRTLVPFRKIFEALGMEISWDDATKTVGAKSETTEMELYIGKNYALVNQDRKDFDVAPEITDGRTFVPLRFVSESVGAEVIWEAETRSIYIYLHHENSEGKYHLNQEASYNGIRFSVDKMEPDYYQGKVFVSGKISTMDAQILIEVSNGSKTSYSGRCRIDSVASAGGMYNFKATIYIPSNYNLRYLYVKAYEGDSNEPFRISEYLF